MRIPLGYGWFLVIDHDSVFGKDFTYVEDRSIFEENVEILPFDKQYLIWKRACFFASQKGLKLAGVEDKQRKLEEMCKQSNQ